MKRGGMAGVTYRHGRRLAPKIAVPEAELRWAVMCAYAMKRGVQLSRTESGVVGRCENCGRERIVDLANVSSDSTKSGVFRLADLLIAGFPSTFGLWCRSCQRHTPAATQKRRSKAVRSRRTRTVAPVLSEEAIAWANEIVARESTKARAARVPSAKASPPDQVDVASGPAAAGPATSAPAAVVKPAVRRDALGHTIEREEGDVREFESACPKAAAAIRSHYGAPVDAARDSEGGWVVILSDGGRVSVPAAKAA